MEDLGGVANARPGAPVEEPLSWCALLEAYRLGPKERWSEALIERLGPWLATARQTLIAVPPFIDENDVAQELVFEVLRIAARWRPRCEDRWIPRRLVEWAERRVRNRLRRERIRLAAAAELSHELAAGEEADSGLLFDTPVGKASAADLRVLYRVKVLGEPVEALAREAGITPRQMRRRLQAARERARC